MIQQISSLNRQITHLDHIKIKQALVNYSSIDAVVKAADESIF